MRVRAVVENAQGSLQRSLTIDECKGEKECAFCKKSVENVCGIRFCGLSVSHSGCFSFWVSIPMWEMPAWERNCGRCMWLWRMRRRQARSMKVPMRTIKRPMAECMIHWICVRFWNRKKKRVDMNRKEPGECGLCAIMTGCRSGWNRSEKQGKARMPFIREVGINCTPLCMENCGRSWFCRPRFWWFFRCCIWWIMRGYIRRRIWF